MRNLLLVAILTLWTSAHASLIASPSLLDFYDTPINGFGRSQSVLVENLGPTAVQVQTTNSCFGDFVVSGFCNLTLGPSQSCTLDVHFQPRQEGQQSCMIQIRDSLGSTAFVSVSGRGVRQN